MSAAGVQSDHETVAADEALEKIRLGMWLFAREGTMRNLEALLPVDTGASPGARLLRRRRQDVP